MIYIIPSYSEHENDFTSYDREEVKAECTKRGDSVYFDNAGNTYYL